MSIQVHAIPAAAETAPEPREIDITGDPTAVYRLYAADGSLLYIGETGDIRKRFYLHSRDKAWWPEVARATMCWYGSEAKALDAEQSAIRAEKPLHNARKANGSSKAVARPQDALAAYAAVHGVSMGDAVRLLMGRTPPSAWAAIRTTREAQP